jgi:predicted small secreted protein
MNLKKIIVMVTLLAFLAGALFSSGCSNTWKGAGKDVEKTGEKMQGKPQGEKHDQ